MPEVIQRVLEVSTKSSSMSEATSPDPAWCVCVVRSSYLLLRELIVAPEGRALVVIRSLLGNAVSPIEYNQEVPPLLLHK